MTIPFQGLKKGPFKVNSCNQLRRMQLNGSQKIGHLGLQMILFQLKIKIQQLLKVYEIISTDIGIRTCITTSQKKKKKKLRNVKYYRVETIKDSTNATLSTLPLSSLVPQLELT